MFAKLRPPENRRRFSPGSRNKYTVQCFHHHRQTSILPEPRLRPTLSSINKPILEPSPRARERVACVVSSPAYLDTISQSSRGLTLRMDGLGLTTR